MLHMLVPLLTKVMLLNVFLALLSTVSSALCILLSTQLLSHYRNLSFLHDLHNCYNNISASEYKYKLIILLLYDVIF